MKPDTERRKHHRAKLHKKRSNLHVHLSKDLRKKLKRKKRSILLRKDDRVKILKGPGKGKEGKVTRVDVKKRRIFVEGVTVRNSRAKEVLLPLQPSNLIIVALEPTKERKELFSEEAFKKPPKKPEKPEPEKKEVKEEKPAQKPAEEPKAPEAPAPKR